jgi:hypothetical protein
MMIDEMLRSFHREAVLDRELRYGTIFAKRKWEAVFLRNPSCQTSPLCELTAKAAGDGR